MSAWQVAIVGGAVGILIDRSGRRLAQIASVVRERRAERASEIELTRDVVVTQVREGVIEAVRRHLDGENGKEAAP